MPCDIVKYFRNVILHFSLVSSSPLFAQLQKTIKIFHLNFCLASTQRINEKKRKEKRIKWKQEAKNTGLWRTTDNHLGMGGGRGAGDDKRLALNLADLHKSAQPSSQNLPIEACGCRCKSPSSRGMPRAETFHGDKVPYLRVKIVGHMFRVWVSF